MSGHDAPAGDLAFGRLANIALRQKLEDKMGVPVMLPSDGGAPSLRPGEKFLYLRRRHIEVFAQVDWSTTLRFACVRRPLTEEGVARLQDLLSATVTVGAAGAINVDFSEETEHG